MPCVPTTKIRESSRLGVGPFRYENRGVSSEVGGTAGAVARGAEADSPSQATGEELAPGMDMAGMYPACYSKAPKDHDLEGRYHRSLVHFLEVKS